MAKLLIKKATTSVTVYVFIQDSSVATGAGKTGLAYNTSSLVAYYVRPLGSATAITLATQTVTGAFSSGGFVEVDATNMPGVYRVDLPDAVCATGVNSAVVMLKGASNMAPSILEIQLVSFDPNDAVRAGLTSLPNAAAEAAGGLYTRGTGAGQINQPSNGSIDTNAIAISGDSTAADNAESFFDGTGYAGTNNVIPLVTTVTNLTNAASAGDLTATMKTSVTTAATAATPTAAAVTGNVGGNVTGSVGSLATQAKADVNAEVVDVMATDTYAEPGQASPAATASLAAKINYLFKAWRNKKTQTSTTWSLFADDASTVDQKSTVSDDGTTATRGEVATGP